MRQDSLLVVYLLLSWLPIATCDLPTLCNGRSYVAIFFFFFGVVLGRFLWSSLSTSPKCCYFWSTSCSACRMGICLSVHLKYWGGGFSTKRCRCIISTWPFLGDSFGRFGRDGLCWLKIGDSGCCCCCLLMPPSSDLYHHCQNHHHHHHHHHIILLLRLPFLASSFLHLLLLL